MFSLILGKDFRSGGIILPIVLFGIVAWNFAMFGHKGLEYRNKTKTMFIYVIICTIVKIILNFLFIPHYGFIAAAITTLVAFLIYPVLVYFGTKNDIKWNIPWVTIAKSFIASIIPISIIYPLGTIVTSSILKLLISAFIMLFFYIPLLYFLREIKEQETTYVKKIFSNLIMRKNH